MKDFIEKWKKDKRFRTKIKLALYILFVVIVSIYAISLDTGESTKDNISNTNNPKNPTENTSNNNTEDTIKIPTEYQETININIDGEEITYIINKTETKEIITKKDESGTNSYLYQNEKYYKYLDDSYLITNKEEVYDKVNYNYLNLANINKYLSSAKKENNQYMVYLKDIILGEEGNDYFIISINNNKINIDYTPLMKHFNSSYETYLVDITIKEVKTIDE